MRSNEILLKGLALISSFYFIGCGGPAVDKSDDNLIGTSVQTVSAIKATDGSESKNIVIFDETVRRIHQFDVTKMSFVRSLEVKDPSEKHYVLYNDIGNYVIDLTNKGLTIFNKYGQANKDPIHFEGKPISAAFRQDLNLLVVYDDLMTVGILKLDANGEVIKTWVGGGNILNDLSISAGDISVDGKLVLALSDNSMVVVNIDQTIATNDGPWVLEAGSPFTTGLTGIKWIAPVQGQPEQFLVRSSSKLALIDASTRAVVATYDLSDYVVTKVSKSIDAHVILRSYKNETDNMKLVYIEGSQFREKTLFHAGDNVLTTTLSLQDNTWYFVDTKRSVTSIFDNIDDVRSDRTYKNYRLSDLRSRKTAPVPNNVQVQLADKFIFALFPSELGLATRTNTDSMEVTELKLFNIGYISKN